MFFFSSQPPSLPSNYHHLPLLCALAKRHCVVPGAAGAAAARSGISLPDARPSQARRMAAAMPTLAAGTQMALAALPPRARPEMAAGAAAGLLRHALVFRSRWCFGFAEAAVAAALALVPAVRCCSAAACFAAAPAATLALFVCAALQERGGC